ncbi:hypothetical protein SAMN05216320_101666 [Duganella sp. OV458]|nr:hypothetical protein SAMN05216320_101666 [Duganella sp. OV458]SDI69489.1 hypothetical protein SAMN05428973_101749 [Duganella sp. OV510]
MIIQAIQLKESNMKQFHLTGKFACALIATAAIISGCQKKEVDAPPVPEATPAPAATPAPVTPPVNNMPATDGGTTTQPDPNAPPPATPPVNSTEPTPTTNK